MRIKLNIIILLMAFGAISANAQKRFDPVKFKADLHNYIITQAKLSDEEAARFFPLYDEMKDKQRGLQKQIRSFMKNKPTTEAACRSAIVSKDDVEIQMKKIEKSYHSRFLNVISAQKLYDILKAEADFHKNTFRKVVKKYQ